MVREGLSGPVKSLPAWLLHDADGARLLDRLTRQPTWYPARAERFLLETHTDAILDAAGAAEAAWSARPGSDLEAPEVVELGPCTATRSRLLLAALARRRATLRFVPIDVAPSAALRLLRIAGELPGVEIAPRLVGGAGGLGRLAGVPRLVLLLGGVLGTMELGEARALLAAVRTAVGPHGGLILGVDHCRDRDVLRMAYADPEGVAAALNRNVLARVNRELDARFDVHAVRHVVRWCPTLSRVELSLESLRRQHVHIDALGLRIGLAEGERIRTAWCAQHDVAGLDALLARAAMARVGTWFDPTERYAVHVARAR